MPFKYCRTDNLTVCNTDCMLCSTGVLKYMRHIYTVSIDTDLERELDEYQKSKGYQTRSEGAIQLLRKGLQYDSKIEELKAENEKLNVNKWK